MITIYVVPPITDTRILPTSTISSSLISSSISLRGSPGEYIPVSFAIKPSTAIASLQIAATDLVGPATIPAANVDIRVVKVWWQCGIEVWDAGDYAPRNPQFVPELLLKDDSLVKVEGSNNYLKVSGAYVKISDPTGIPGIPDEPSTTQFPVKDASTLQPVDIPANTNKQFWVTVKVPDNAVAGTYLGTISLTGGATGQLQVTLEVLPITLLQPGIVTSISHLGYPHSSPTIAAYQKSDAQYKAELQNMLAHGVSNPPLVPWDSTMVAKALTIRNSVGMGGQPFYCYCDYDGAGRQSTAADLAALKTKTQALISLARSYGMTDVYIYGIDEASGSTLTGERPSFQAVHDVGGKIWVAGGADVFAALGDLVDLFRWSYHLDKAEAAKWHSVGHQIFSYGNPQGGMEQPVLYRRNYGLLLWQYDYDGGMTAYYQANYGNIWNDFDNTEYRDHNMTYPTVDGVIDTVQWEGFREGVTDLRYLNTLLYAIQEAKVAGGNTSAAESWLATLKASNLATLDLNTIRANMIDQILALTEVGNVFSPGQAKTAQMTIKVSLAGLAMQLELWLGPNETTKTATSGKISFTSTGANQNLTVPIIMPTAVGTYQVYVDVFYQSKLLIGFITMEPVSIQ